MGSPCARRHAPVPVWSWVAVVLLGAACSAGKSPLPSLDETTRRELIAYLDTHRRSPSEYIFDQFRDHDVVFLGEPHYVAQHVELVRQLIRDCPRHGVFTLCTEFVRREDQPLLDRLLDAPSYDDALARRIAFQQYVHWGYAEYLQIFRAAWELNRDLPEDVRFRIFGLNDSPDWSLIRSPGDAENDSIRAAVWRGGGERYWAAVILDSVVARGRKALVYSGMHHAFTEFQQPIVLDGGFVRFETDRMGNFVFRAIGKRAVTICLHHPWPSASGYGSAWVYPADGTIDALMAGFEASHDPVGFDTRGTPFGTLTGATSVYHHGSEHFTLGQFCDGYVFLVPISEYTGVEPIRDFVDEDNLQAARLEAPNPEFRNASVQDFRRAAARAADVTERYAHLR